MLKSSIVMATSLAQGERIQLFVLQLKSKSNNVPMERFDRFQRLWSHKIKLNAEWVKEATFNGNSVHGLHKSENDSHYQQF